MKYNAFFATVVCPHCKSHVHTWFNAEIGELRSDDFAVGDLVIKNVPLKKPYGPNKAIDVLQPFWGIGVGTCQSCRSDLAARVHVRDRRYVGVTPPLDSDDLFASGYTSAIDEAALAATPFLAGLSAGLKAK